MKALLQLIAGVLMLLALGAGVLSILAHEEWSGLNPWLSDAGLNIRIALAMMIGALAADRRARRLARREDLGAAERQPLSELNPDVLYLRRFASDLKAKPRSYWNLEGKTDEEWLLDPLLNFHGRRILAIHDPQMSLPPLGAERALLEPGDWVPQVTTLAQRAKLVIMRLGLSPGARREFQMLVEAQLLAKTVLLLPGDEQPSLMLHWANALSVLNASPSLPSILHALDGVPTSAEIQELTELTNQAAQGPEAKLSAKAFAVRALFEKGVPASVVAAIWAIAARGIVGLTFAPEPRAWVRPCPDEPSHQVHPREWGHLLEKMVEHVEKTASAAPPAASGGSQ